MAAGGRGAEQPQQEQAAERADQQAQQDHRVPHPLARLRQHGCRQRAADGALRVRDERHAEAGVRVPERHRAVRQRAVRGRRHRLEEPGEGAGVDRRRRPRPLRVGERRRLAHLTGDGAVRRERPPHRAIVGKAAIDDERVQRRARARARASRSEGRELQEQRSARRVRRPRSWRARRCSFGAWTLSVASRDAGQDRRHAVPVQRRHERDRAAGARHRAVVAERLGEHPPGDHERRQRRVERAAGGRAPALELDRRAGRRQAARGASRSAVHTASTVWSGTSRSEIAAVAS